MTVTSQTHYSVLVVQFDENKIINDSNISDTLFGIGVSYAVVAMESLLHILSRRLYISWY